MAKIHLNLDQQKDRSYDIVVEDGVLFRIGDLLRRKKFAKRYAVIADSNVAQIYGKKILESLKIRGLKSFMATFPAGEKNKNLQTAEKLMEKLLKKRITRQDGIIALGGGVTSDLAGFVASVYLRGIALIHAPTSLLAMVDAGIGGKTGINLTKGKNLAGTFYQPNAVLIDPTVLKTLPESDFLNGFAEIIKYGIIADDKLFRILEKNTKMLLNRKADIMNKIIIRCCQIKASITEKDERENGTRMTLNYGHSVGHAIEKLSSYTISHGRAISLGMRITNDISYKLERLGKKERMRINNLFNRFSLHDKFEDIFSDKNAPAKLWSIMQNDKKVRESKIHFIMAKTIGKTIICDRITKKDFMSVFENTSK